MEDILTYQEEVVNSVEDPIQEEVIVNYNVIQEEEPDNIIKGEYEDNESGIPSDSSISGNNVINNNYNTENVYMITTVSENTVLDNLIDKPLKDYNTQEGLLFMLFVGFMCVGVVHIIRKGIFRWN